MEVIHNLLHALLSHFIRAHLGFLIAHKRRTIERVVIVSVWSEAVLPKVARLDQASYPHDLVIKDRLDLFDSDFFVPLIKFFAFGVYFIQVKVVLNLVQLGQFFFKVVQDVPIDLIEDVVGDVAGADDQELFLDKFFNKL